MSMSIFLSQWAAGTRQRLPPARRGGYHPPVFPRNCWPRGARRLGAPSTCRGAPGGAPARRAHRFWCQKRWENHQGLRALDPGFMAAVGCVRPAKTGSALPPALLAVSLRALPRLGWHASRLPRKPYGLLLCTSRARRAAVGAMPLNCRGGYGGAGPPYMAAAGVVTARWSRTRRSPGRCRPAPPPAPARPAPRAPRPAGPPGRRA